MSSTQVALPPADEQRRRGLRIMRSVATGLLVLAAAVFVWTLRFAPSATWVGYLRAAAEAAMVGAIADWFAVTAIFRHPLGMPVPHTALIPKGKDAIGRGLGEFIQGNFLAPGEVAERIREAHPAARLGKWLSEPANAAGVATQLAAVTRTTVEMLKDDEVQDSIESIVASRVRAIPLAPLLGSAIDHVMAEGRHHVLVDGALTGLGKAVLDNRDVLRSRLAQESPWWVPEAVDDAVFRRILDGVQSFIADLQANPHHEMRRHLDSRAASLAERMRHSPEMGQRVDELKEELLNHPEFREWAAGLWKQLKADLLQALERPESAIRLRIERMIVDLARRLRSDSDLQETVDRWLADTAERTLTESGGEIVSLVSGTVDRWDAKETSSRIELLVGRDLQYIRINGTVVGALVGLLIKSLSDALG